MNILFCMFAQLSVSTPECADLEAGQGVCVRGVDEGDLIQGVAQGAQRGPQPGQLLPLPRPRHPQLEGAQLGADGQHLAQPVAACGDTGSWYTWRGE